MLLYLCAAVTLLGVASAGTVANSNYYVDTVVLSNLTRELGRSKQDPLAIRDFTTVFNDRIALVTVNVKTDYSRGNLTGLSRAQRARSCSPTQFLRGQYRINCTLSMNSLEVNYQGTTKYGKVPSISIRAKAPASPIFLDVEIASNSRGYNPYISQFRVNNAIQLNPQFTGLGAASSFLKGLQNSFRGNATNVVMDALNNVYRSSMERSIKNSVMPL